MSVQTLYPINPLDYLGIFYFSKCVVTVTNLLRKDCRIITLFLCCVVGVSFLPGAWWVQYLCIGTKIWLKSGTRNSARMHHYSWPQYRQAKRTLNFWCGYGRQTEIRAGSMSNNYSKYLKARWFTASQSLILKQNENPRLMVKVNSKVMSFIVNVFHCSWRNNNYFLDS